MTLALPLYDGTPETLQFILDLIARAFVDTGGRQLKLRGGIGTLAWPGGATASTALTVSHGMGSTPIAVVGTSKTASGVATICPIRTDTFGATTFSARAETTDGSSPLNTATLTFSWVALG